MKASQAATSIACAVLLQAGASRAAGTEDGQNEAVPLRRWAVGLQVGLADRPSGHLGIPLGGGEMGSHLPHALVGAYQASPTVAVTAGLGLPTGAMGVGLWGGFEASLRLAGDAGGIFALRIYEDAGLQLGFAGPDYYARHDNEFVGYSYAFAGPLAFAIRLPVGFRASWLHDRFDTYVEGLDVLALTPSFESLFELTAGVRVRF
jgi:hypothetical protein